MPSACLGFADMSDPVALALACLRGGMPDRTGSCSHRLGPRSMPIWLALAVFLAPEWCGAATRHSVLLGGETWRRPEVGGHGLVMAAADRYGLPRGGHMGLEYNTDTVRLRADGFRFCDGRLELGGGLEGEAYYAGLLPDYYRHGRRLADRGFWASYAGAQVRAKLNLPGHHFPELAVGVRQWWFARHDRTAPTLVLPPDTPVLEARLRHTWWRLADDAAWRERHRSYPRLRGIAAGLEVGVDWRGWVRAWGGRDAATFAPVDGRNDPESVILMLRQWLRSGRQLGPNWRLQLTQSAAWGRGEDDLTRLRLGGMNPYVVPLAGAPWRRGSAGAPWLHR